MDFIPEVIARYAEEHTQKESKLLEELGRETWQKALTPRMLSGHLQGRFLAMLSKITKPQKILEIGTYTGYSALCLAEGLTKKGVLHTIDNNEELRAFQKKYFNRSEFSTQIIQHTGEALEILPDLDEVFDLVFIDADKINYPRYFDLLFPKLKKHGILLADNVLWSGKVIDDRSRKDAETQAIIEYNTKLKTHKQLEVLLLPLRDGISIARKL